MFATGFQSFAFQTAGLTNTPQPAQTTEGGGFVYPYERLRDEQYQREKLRKQKTELEKLDSVLRETERKRDLAAESREIALKAKKDKRNAERLARLEQELLDEISRLLMVRADLMRRVKQSEEMLIVMLAMKRKRLRAINWQVNKPLAIT